MKKQNENQNKRVYSKKKKASSPKPPPANMPSADEIRQIIKDKKLSRHVSPIQPPKPEEGKVNDDVRIELPDIFYYFPELETLFKRNRKTIQKWVDLGGLPYSELGKSRVFYRQDIINMLMRFRRSSLIWLGYFISLLSDWDWAVSL